MKVSYHMAAWSQQKPAAYGKLRWVFCLGKIVLGPLYDIKKCHCVSREGDNFPLGERLTDALEFIENALLAPPFPSLVRCQRRGQRPTLVWSDAMWEPRPGLPFGFGRIGFVVKAPRKDDGYGIYCAKSEVPAGVPRSAIRPASPEGLHPPAWDAGDRGPIPVPPAGSSLERCDRYYLGDSESANGVAIKRT